MAKGDRKPEVEGRYVNNMEGRMRFGRKSDAPSCVSATRIFGLTSSPGAIPTLITSNKTQSMSAGKSPGGREKPDRRERKQLLQDETRKEAPGAPRKKRGFAEVAKLIPVRVSKSN